MKLVLASGLAVALLSVAPAYGAANSGSDSSQTGQSAGQNSGMSDQGRGSQPDRTQGARPHRGHRQFATGDHLLPRRLLRGRHVVQNYQSLGLEAPASGEEWVRAHGRLFLVSADGVVQDVEHRRRGGGQHRARREQRQEQQHQQDDSRQGQSQ